jgi:glycerol-3-phosphate cytidylyltransferase
MHLLYTGGTFDIPHLGHYNFFKQCKKLFTSSYLLVSLNTDEFIEEYKGHKPLYSYDERKYFLSLVDYVDKVVPNVGGADSTVAINLYKPNVIVIGNDWLEKDYCKQMGFDAQWLRDKSISLVYIPYTEGISTSEIKRRLANVG